MVHFPWHYKAVASKADGSNYMNPLGC